MKVIGFSLLLVIKSSDPSNFPEIQVSKLKTVQSKAKMSSMSSLLFLKSIIEGLDSRTYSLITG